MIYKRYNNCGFETDDIINEWIYCKSFKQVRQNSEKLLINLNT